eukprot:1553611-Rhodomonas_salina.2
MLHCTRRAAVCTVTIRSTVCRQVKYGCVGPTRRRWQYLAEKGERSVGDEPGHAALVQKDAQGQYRTGRSERVAESA